MIEKRSTSSTLVPERPAMAAATEPERLRAHWLLQPSAQTSGELSSVWRHRTKLRSLSTQSKLSSRFHANFTQLALCSGMKNGSHLVHRFGKLCLEYIFYKFWQDENTIEAPCS